MSLDPQILANLPHTVTVTEAGSVDEHNEPVFGASREVKAYIPPLVRVSRGREQEEIRLGVNAVLPEEVGLNDLITVGEKRYTVQHVEKRLEIEGLEHYVVGLE